MVRFVAARVIRTLVTVLAVLTFAFVLARLAGDPVRLMLPDQATDADVAAMRTSLGLDLPLHIQYGHFLGQALHGDLGTSLRQGVPALDLVLERLPATLELALLSFAVGLVLAVALAVLGEVTGSQPLRTAILWLATARQSVPPYLFGILLILVFSVWWGVLPSMGRQGWQSYVLPVATMATFEIALYLRLLNSTFAELRHDDFVRTARAKGVGRTRLVLRHMLPNALVPVITVAGINLGILVGGTVVLEMVFNWPGLGRLVIQAVSQRDFPVVQAGVVLIAVLFVVINLVVDLLYAVIDPRVRLS